jgi:hypothetical protein
MKRLNAIFSAILTGLLPVLPLRAVKTAVSHQPLAVILQILGNLFGWLILLTTLVFKLPDITRMPCVSACWIISSGIIFGAYLLPLAVIARHSGLKMLVVGIQTASVLLLFPFFIYGFLAFKGSTVTILGDVVIGNTRVFFSMFFSILLIGAVSGLIRTLHTKTTNSSQ